MWVIWILQNILQKILKSQQGVPTIFIWVVFMNGWKGVKAVQFVARWEIIALLTSEKYVFALLYRSLLHILLVFATIFFFSLELLFIKMSGDGVLWKPLTHVYTVSKLRSYYLYRAAVESVNKNSVPVLCTSSCFLIAIALYVMVICTSYLLV